MLKLGLLGKGIAHSRSREVYVDLLGKEIDYTLFDISCEQEIPTLAEMFASLDGLSITSPYKKVFLKRNEVVSLVPELSAVNCVRKKREGDYEATNTDFLALKKIFRELIINSKELEILILGNGSMSELTQLILTDMNYDYRLYARDLNNPDLNSLDYGFFDLAHKTPLIVNTCAREFIFEARIPKQTIFWDYNYSLKHHQDGLSGRCDYRDGLELLKLQAQFALDFWGVADGIALE